MSTVAKCRGVRGAIKVLRNSNEEIAIAAEMLLSALFDENQIDPAEIVAIFFTVTPDLNAAFPAAAARTLGLAHVPLLCAQEIAVPGALDHCLRVLIQWNTCRSAAEIRPVYLGEAESLRPDLGAAAFRGAKKGS